jgi:putative N6-adenine-specific DNA methylase
MGIAYFATVARGLETIAAQELSNLGAENIKIDFTGVHFQGNQELLYRVNLWARTIFRVLMPIETIKCQNAAQLYRNVSLIDWSQYLHPQQTLAIRCTGKNQQLNNSHITAIQIKKAIVEQQQQQTGIRSEVDTRNPDILINAHINKNKCTISLDSSGDSLHRRGYRPAMGIAPLKETLAAALLYLTEWNPQTPLLDPFCGSGTIVLEATMMGLNIAPGLYRAKFALENWTDFNSDLWHKLKKEAKNAQKSDLPIIIGSDVEAEMIKQAQSNAEACGLAQKVQFVQRHLADIQPPTDTGIVLCNPPYGVRIADTESLYPLYQLLGDLLKQRFQGWTAYILCGNKELSKRIGLRTNRRIPIDNGGIKCTLLKYELY